MSKKWQIRNKAFSYIDYWAKPPVNIYIEFEVNKGSDGEFTEKHDSGNAYKETRWDRLFSYN